MVTTRRNPTLFPYRGKWRVTYVDRVGKTRSKTLATKHDCYVFIAGLSQDTPPTPSGAPLQEVPTLGNWLATWQETRSAGLRPKTLILNQILFTTHVIPALGATALNMISVNDIESLYQSLVHDTGLAITSVHRIHTALAAPFQTAFREGIIPTNPMTQVRKPKAPKPRITPLSLQHLEAVWGVISRLPASQQLRWILALKYGLRQAEALGLHRQDFESHAQVIRITRQLQRIPHQGWVFTPPKSAQGIRDIPVDDQTAGLIKQVIEELPDGCDLLFPDPTGNPRHASTDRKAWLRLLKNAGVPEVSLHTARHTAATVMITSGVDVKTVQIVLGHSTPSFTLATYVHPSVDDVRRSLRHIF
jgi:integrase